MNIKIDNEYMQMQQALVAAVGKYIPPGEPAGVDLYIQASFAALPDQLREAAVYPGFQWVQAPFQTGWIRSAYGFIIRGYLPKNQRQIRGNRTRLRTAPDRAGRRHRPAPSAPHGCLWRRCAHRPSPVSGRRP